LTAIEKYIHSAHPSSAQRLGRKSRDKTPNRTHGKPLPEFAKTTGDTKDFADKLKAFVAKQGISLEYDKSIAPALGFPPEKHSACSGHAAGRGILGPGA